MVTGEELWLRGRYSGDNARLEYSLDGQAFTDTGLVFVYGSPAR